MTSKDTLDIDFSPFNAEGVLRALCSVLRTSKALSFSYAGDIQSLTDRIGRVFNASRCLMFIVDKHHDRVEIFEYVSSGIEPVAFKFAGPYGQQLAEELMDLEGDINTLEDDDQLAKKIAGQLDGGYFLPLKIKGDAARVVAPQKINAPVYCICRKAKIIAGINLFWIV